MAIGPLQVELVNKVDEYCLFWSNWGPLCMPKSEWASWVQAVGSVAAILAAFLIAYNQSVLARREKIKSDFAAAFVIGTYVADHLVSIKTFFSVLQNDLEGRTDTEYFHAQKYRDQIDELILPTESQLLHLAPVINDGAIAIGRTLMFLRRIRGDLHELAMAQGVILSTEDFSQQITAVRFMVEQALPHLTSGQEALKVLLKVKQLSTAQHVLPS